MTTKKFLIALAAIIVLVILYYAFNAFIYTQKQGNGQPTDPYRATLSGVQVCLPHKDTTGPQTMECAMGLKTDAGEYYALDFNTMSQSPIPPSEIGGGKRFTANGLVTPIENLSSNHWQKYDVEGIFSVTDSIQVDGTPPTPTQGSGTTSGTSPAGGTMPTGITTKLPGGSPVPGNPALLRANVWVWEGALIGGDAAIAPNNPEKFTLAFGADGSVTGGTDCNGFGGTYQAGSDGVLTFGPFMSTKMYCEGSQESTYTGLMMEVRSYRIDSATGKLILSTQGGGNTVTFRKK